MKKERIEYIAHLVIAVAGAAAFGVIFFRYVFGAILPFLFGWLTAFAARVPAAALSKRTRIAPRVWRLVIAAVVIVGAIVLLLSIGRLALGELWNLLAGLGEDDKFGETVGALAEQMLGIFGRLNLPPEVEEGITDSLMGIVSSLLGSLGGALTGLVAAVPHIALTVVITVIATVYFALDLERINSAVKRILPESVCALLSGLKNGALTLGVKYLRSYLIIMLVTFAVMLVGFLILGVEYAFLLAILLAVLDLLPVIGVGTALVPASIFCFVSGNRTLAIGLLVLFAVNEVIRQLAEPRILGKHLGIHPLATLAAVYIGYSFFGFVGILILPLLALLVGIYKDDPTEVTKSP